MKSDPTFWILARASGVVAYLLLTSSVLAGLLVKTRALGRRVRPAAVTDLHRFLGLLGLGAIALHGTALVLDKTVHMSPLALVVPGQSPYRPLATTLGVVAAELMALVYVSFRVKRWLGHKAWRALHWFTYVVFAAATIHGLTAGTDATQRWFTDMTVGAVGAVAAATVWRVLVRTKGASRVPRADRSLTV